MTLCAFSPLIIMRGIISSSTLLWFALLHYYQIIIFFAMIFISIFDFDIFIAFHFDIFITALFDNILLCDALLLFYIISSFFRYFAYFFIITSLFRLLFSIIFHFFSSFSYFFFLLFIIIIFIFADYLITSFRSTHYWFIIFSFAMIFHLFFFYFDIFSSDFHYLIHFDCHFSLLLLLLIIFHIYYFHYISFSIFAFFADFHYFHWYFLYYYFDISLFSFHYLFFIFHAYYFIIIFAISLILHFLHIYRCRFIIIIIIIFDYAISLRHYFRHSRFWLFFSIISLWGAFYAAPRYARRYARRLCAKDGTRGAPCARCAWCLCAKDAMARRCSPVMRAVLRKHMMRSEFARARLMRYGKERVQCAERRKSAFTRYAVWGSRVMFSFDIFPIFRWYFDIFSIIRFFLRHTARLPLSMLMFSRRRHYSSHYFPFLFRFLPRLHCFYARAPRACLQVAGCYEKQIAAADSGAYSARVLMFALLQIRAGGEDAARRHAGVRVQEAYAEGKMSAARSSSYARKYTKMMRGRYDAAAFPAADASLAAWYFFSIYWLFILLPRCFIDFWLIFSALIFITLRWLLDADFMAWRRQQPALMIRYATFVIFSRSFLRFSPPMRRRVRAKMRCLHAMFMRSRRVRRGAGTEWRIVRSAFCCHVTTADTCHDYVFRFLRYAGSMRGWRQPRLK